MTHYRHPSIKASETVTFRLTVEEKTRLNKLAELEQKSKTDLVRRLLAEEASRKGLSAPSIPTGPTRPTRPTRPTGQTPLKQSLLSELPMETFGDLVGRFRDSFRDRAEGTRKELDDTLRILTGVESNYPPLFPMEMPIGELTSEKLQDVRKTISLMDMRVAKKNLHLTYLRMMLHYAVKQSARVSINPALELASFTVSELPKAWPGKRD